MNLFAFAAARATGGGGSRAGCRPASAGAVRDGERAGARAAAGGRHGRGRQGREGFPAPLGQPLPAAQR